MNLTEAYLLLAVMLAVVAVVSVLFKGKSGLIAPLIFVAGLITALVAGLGFRLREVTEGPVDIQQIGEGCAADRKRHV